MFEGYSLKELITTWLEVTKDRKIPVDIDVEGGLRRARAILPLLREGNFSAARFQVDESRDALYALVSLVTDSGDAGAPGQQDDARLVHDFISRVWPEPDEFGFKEVLLEDCKVLAGDEVSSRSDGDARVEDPVLLPTPADSDERAAQDAFRDSLWLLDLILRAEYDLGEPEAVLAEKALYAWFVRLWKRGGRTEDYRPILLSTCCQLGASLRGGTRVGPNRPQNEVPVTDLE